MLRNSFDDLTAIVVDDNRDTVDVFCEYLRMYNVNVIGEGYDGKSAVELYWKAKPDITFLDTLMPQYDGIYALQKIRKANPKARVVMITADLRGDTEQKLEALRPDKIIYKPFEYGKIVDAIDNIRKVGFI
ncbi:MAG: response regulator [Thaumarchaeota archaeon]|nr:response regulator [Nitrososphaerota archaeon]